MCWQHAHTLRHRYKSLTRNQSVGFIIGAVGVLIGLPSLYYSYQSSRPPKPQHTHVQYLNPAEAPAPIPPTVPFKEGQPVPVNVGFSNMGTEVADNCHYNGGVVIQRGRANEETLFQNFLNANPLIKCSQMLPPKPGSQDYQFHTFLTPALSAADVSDLERENAAICATSRVQWSDQTGNYQTDYCACLESSYQTFPQAPVMSWHSCQTHNDETKLPLSK